MIPLEFLQRVLPTEGFYVSTIINKGEAPQQAFFSTVGELANYCLMADKNGNNVYYAVSSFEKRGNRTQKNVCLNKTLFLDIDCGPDKVDQVDNSGDPIEDKGYHDHIIWAGAPCLLGVRGGATPGRLATLGQCAQR